MRLALGGFGLLASPVIMRAQRRAVPRDTVPADTTRRLQQLERQVITGTRLSRPTDREPARVDRPDLQVAPPSPAAAADILSSLPGVSSIDDQGSRVQPTLTLRGFTLSPVVGIPQGVSVFLDGVRVNEPDAQELNFDLLPMDAVTNATLIRGPATLFGKNTLAGALLLTTARGDSTPHASATVEDGAFGFHGASATASGLLPGLRGIDGYVTGNASDERGWRDATLARTRMIFANIGKKSETSDVALTVIYAHDRALLAGSLPESWIGVDPQANYTAGDFYEPDLLHVALRGERVLPLGTMRGNLFFRRNNVQQFNANAVAPSTSSITQNRSAGGTVEWTLPSRIGDHDLSLTVGAEYSRNDVGYRTYAERTPDSDSIPQDCDQQTGLCVKARVPEDDGALYAEAVLAASAKLSLTAAARADYVRVPFRDLLDPGNDGTNVFRQLSPRIAATYRFAPRTSAYASVSTGFRAPAALELACADENAPCSLPSALGGDPRLEPVTVHTYEIGLNQTLFSDAHIGISAYRTDVRNEIVFVASTVTAGFFQNIHHTRRQGVEVTGDAALPVGFHADASYTYTDATYESTVALASELDNNVVQPGGRFPLTPAHQARISLENTHAFTASVLSASISLRAMSSQFLRGDEANNERPIPSFATTDARVRWDRTRFTLSGYLTNVFNRTYVSFGVYGENPFGPIGGPVPAVAPVERFLTPGYPRAVTISASVHI